VWGAHLDARARARSARGATDFHTTGESWDCRETSASLLGRLSTLPLSVTATIGRPLDLVLVGTSLGDVVLLVGENTLLRNLLDSLLEELNSHLGELTSLRSRRLGNASLPSLEGLPKERTVDLTNLRTKCGETLRSQATLIGRDLAVRDELGKVGVEEVVRVEHLRLSRSATADTRVDESVRVLDRSNELLGLLLSLLSELGVLLRDDSGIVSDGLSHHVAEELTHLVRGSQTSRVDLRLASLGVEDRLARDLITSDGLETAATGAVGVLGIVRVEGEERSESAWSDDAVERVHLAIILSLSEEEAIVQASAGQLLQRGALGDASLVHGLVGLEDELTCDLGTEGGLSEEVHNVLVELLRGEEARVRASATTSLVQSEGEAGQLLHPLDDLTHQLAVFVAANLILALLSLRVGEGDLHRDTLLHLRERISEHLDRLDTLDQQVDFVLENLLGLSTGDLVASQDGRRLASAHRGGEITAGSLS